jgi:hypothetical protein
LQTLKLLSASGRSTSGEVLWAVRVLYHSLSSEDMLKQMRDIPMGTVGCEACYSVLDVIKYSEDDDASENKLAMQRHSRSKKKRRNQRADHTDEAYDTMRHFVMGVWKGPNSLPAIDSLASIRNTPCAASEHATSPQCEGAEEIGPNELETWHETTLSAMALCGLAARKLLSSSTSAAATAGCQSHRILLVGASLAAVASFLQLLCRPVCPVSSPVHITLLECDAAIMKTVQDHFSFEAVNGLCEGCTVISGMPIPEFVAAWKQSNDLLHAQTQSSSTSTVNVPSPYGYYDAILVGCGAMSKPDIRCSTLSDTWHDLLSMLHPSGVLALHEPAALSSPEAVFGTLQTALVKCNEITAFVRKFFVFTESQLGGDNSARCGAEDGAVYVCWPERLSGGSRSISVNWWQKNIEDSKLIERLTSSETVMWRYCYVSAGFLIDVLFLPPLLLCGCVHRKSPKRGFAPPHLPWTSLQRRLRELYVFRLS